MIIWQTYRNADDIEGRGPMVPDLAFMHKEHAANYIDIQPGVFGRKGKWSEQEYGDWYMRPIEVLEHDFLTAKQEKEDLKIQALAKLSSEEKEVLGLT